jgi:hypothetical protein
LKTEERRRKVVIVEGGGGGGEEDNMNAPEGCTFITGIQKNLFLLGGSHSLSPSSFW